jgi:hypothetical protein
MEINSSKKKKMLYVLLAFLISVSLVIILYVSDIISENHLEQKFQSGKFTIGEIISSEYSKSLQGKMNCYDKKVNTAAIRSIAQIIPSKFSYQIITFTYKIDGKSFITKNSSQDYPNDLDKEPLFGDKYLAIYLLDKPEDCVLLFNYPIKDSTDYNKYIDFFKAHNPRFHSFVYEDVSLKP